MYFDEQYRALLRNVN